MFYSRKIYPSLLQHLSLPQATVITGMRRTGKTTLIKQLLVDSSNPNSLFLDLQNPDNRQLFEIPNYDSIRQVFIQRGLNPNEPMIIAIDEVQLAPQSPSAIKYLSDNYPIKFILTGSSSYYIKNLFSESLSGRKKIFELYPLDFGEFLTFKQVPFSSIDWTKQQFSLPEYNRLNFYYEEYLRFGGFPQVVLATNAQQKLDLLQDIISSYINIDVKTLADFKNETHLYALIKLLAGRVGTKLEYTKLSKLTGLSRPTVVNYLTFLEKTFLIRTLPIYTKNNDRAVVKAKKIYFTDTGLANSLADLSGGAQFENTLSNQLFVSSSSLQYYSLHSGQEIDFVVDQNLAIEAKETPIKEDQNRLDRIAQHAKLSHRRLVGRYSSPTFTQYSWAGSIT